MPELVLVRHGETVGQSSIRLYGATDIALSPEGERQMSAAAGKLDAIVFDRVLTSPLIRARRSAEVMLERMSHPAIAIETVEAFREIDFGHWEGWTWAEVLERDPANHARWSSEGAAFCFPGGETRGEFVARVQAVVPEVIEAAFRAGAQRMLAVVHKGVIKAIAARLLRREFVEFDHAELALGSVHRFELQQGEWRPRTPGWSP